VLERERRARGKQALERFERANAIFIVFVTAGVLALARGERRRVVGTRRTDRPSARRTATTATPSTSQQLRCGQDWLTVVMELGRRRTTPIESPSRRSGGTWWDAAETPPV